MRQLLAARLLAELAAEHPALRPLHRRSLGYVLGRWYAHEGDRATVRRRPGERAELGASAMALRTLTASPYFGRHRDAAERLARGIVALEAPDGSFSAWVGAAPGDDQTALLYFYSGEATLALIELHERTGERRWLDAAVRAADHYVEEYVRGLGAAGFEPALVPWQTFALVRLARLTRKPAYADAAFVLNDRLVATQVAAGAPWPDHVGHFVHPRGGFASNSAATAVYAESLAWAADLARERGDDKRRGRYVTALGLALQNLVRLQFRDEDMYWVADPDAVRGGVRTSVYDPRLRIDNTQHAVDAMRKALTVLGPPDFPPAASPARR